MGKSEKQSDNTKEFLKELNDNFTVEDFTGHLGVLFSYIDGELDEEENEDIIESSFEFLRKIQDIAYKHV